MKTDEKIERLLKIVKAQQKIIEKLAQFYPSGLKGDPLDPTLPGFHAKPTEKRPIDRTFPEQKPVVPGALPAAVKAALDHAVPQMKGSLFLNIDGKNVSLNFNADRIRGKATDVQNAVQKALAPLGYKVLQTIGFNKPTWHPNYL